MLLLSSLWASIWQNKMNWVPREDSDQSRHQPSQRVFTLTSMGLCWCLGWSETLLDSQIILSVLSITGFYIFSWLILITLSSFFDPYLICDRLWLLALKFECLRFHMHVIYFCYRITEKQKSSKLILNKLIE